MQSEVCLCANGHVSVKYLFIKRNLLVWGVQLVENADFELSVAQKTASEFPDQGTLEIKYFGAEWGQRKMLGLWLLNVHQNTTAL